MLAQEFSNAGPLWGWDVLAVPWSVAQRQVGVVVPELAWDWEVLVVPLSLCWGLVSQPRLWWCHSPITVSDASPVWGWEVLVMPVLAWELGDVIREISQSEHS